MILRRTLFATLAIALTLGSAGVAVTDATAQAQAPRPPGPPRNVLTPAQRALVTEANAYFQALSAVRGRFTETGPRGQVQNGTYYLQRPGRARFEYDAPSRLLLVSDGSNVKRYDPRLNTFQAVPLSATPLSVFLRSNVRIDQGVIVDRAAATREGFEIVARDARRPREGSITLQFAGTPRRLTEWTVTDAQGGRTRVQLTTMQGASGLDQGLFVLADPTRGSRRR